MPLCRHCNRSLADSSSLRRHVRVRHPESQSNVSKRSSQHHCPVCQKSFTRAESLRRHKRKHEGLSTTCDICAKPFTRGDYLNIHQLKCARRFLVKACESVEDTLCPGSYDPETSHIRRIEPSSSTLIEAPSLSGRIRCTSEIVTHPHFNHECVLDLTTIIIALRRIMRHGLDVDSEEDCEEALVFAFRLHIEVKAIVDTKSLSGAIMHWATVIFDYNQSSDLDDTLESACFAGFDGLLEPLFWRGADFEDGFHHTFVNLASNMNRLLDTLRFALALGMEPDPKILIYAIEYGRRDIVALLVAYGTNVNDLDCANCFDQTSLELAVSSQDLEMTNLLLSMNADASLGSPLCAAVLWGLTDIATALVRHGADIDKIEPSLWLLEQIVDEGVSRCSLQDLFGYEAKFTALTAAVHTGSVVAVELALSLNGDPNIGDPLLMALKTNELDIAALLVEHGADISAKSEEGGTLLPVAARCAHLGLLHAVLAQKPSPEYVNAVDHRQDTALHAAVHAVADYDTAKVLPVVTTLLDAGFDMRAANKDMATPLSLAITSGSVDLLRLLLSSKPSSDQNKAWLSPALELAVECRDVDIVRILIEAGAEDKDGAIRRQAYLDGRADVIEVLGSLL